MSECDGKCWRMGVGERWFWRALVGLTLALVWYTLVARPPVLRPVAPAVQDRAPEPR